jgi:predicted dehydrogenase/nucleoside-diphosphate-sugar epimerase
MSTDGRINILHFSNAPVRGGTNTSRIWRVGLLGSGYVSQYHLRALKGLSNVKIVGITDLDQDRATRAASAFGVPGVFRTLQDLVKGSHPDVIHVLTPPSSHCALALEALDLGCHVLVEKPMAVSEEECERMIAKARAAGLTLSVNHSARFDPAVLEGLDAVSSGRIGQVLEVEYIRSSEYPPFAGGDLPECYSNGGYPFRDLGVHAFSVIEAFLGEVRQAEGWFRSTGKHVHLNFDEWQARVTCTRGSALIYLSWNSLPMQNIIVVHGTAGALVIDSFLETCSIKRALPGPKAFSLTWNATVGSLAHMTHVALNAARFALGRFGPAPDIQRSISEFYCALSAGTEPPVAAEEGKRIVVFLEKIARPADEVHRESRPVSDTRPAEVLVTGAGGFLGRRLVKSLLDARRPVRALVRRRLSGLSEHPLLRIVYGDLGQPEVVDAAMQGVELVFHVGAATTGRLQDYQCGTIRGTQNVVDAALRHRVKKLVYISSLAILDYAQLCEGARVHENSSLERFPYKRGPYTYAKLQAEKIVLGGVAQGLNAVLVRPGQIFGPGAEDIPPYGTFSIGKRWIVIGRGGMQLPLVYVDDVVDVLIDAAETHTTAGQIIHVVDDQKITQRQYLDACLGKIPHLAITYMPISMLYCGAAAFDILGRALKRSFPPTLYRLRSLKGHLHFDCTTAHQQLGWNPRIGVDEGLKITFGDALTGRGKESQTTVPSACGYCKNTVTRADARLGFSE